MSANRDGGIKVTGYGGSNFLGYGGSDFLGCCSDDVPEDKRIYYSHSDGYGCQKAINIIYNQINESNKTAATVNIEPKTPAATYHVRKSSVAVAAL